MSDNESTFENIVQAMRTIEKHIGLGERANRTSFTKRDDQVKIYSGAFSLDKSGQCEKLVELLRKADFKQIEVMGKDGSNLGYRGFLPINSGTLDGLKSVGKKVIEIKFSEFENAERELSLAFGEKFGRPSTIDSITKAKKKPGLDKN
jgi:hypothetical protein